MSHVSPELWIVAVAITLVAGFIKGAVGFAMPMLMISGLGSFVAPELALAALILPTLATNAWQGLRGGLAAARDAVVKHWRFVAIFVVMVLLSAQLVAVLPRRVLFLLIGLPITAFAAAQLLGWRLSFSDAARRPVEVAVALTSGFIGGLSGVWGPPIVAYLTALDTEKREQVRVQGVLYSIGAVLLLGAHLRSGILNGDTIPLSAILVVPALLGMWAGFRVQDRLDQRRFRTVTLVVLIVAGLNLIRRAVWV